MLHSQPLNFNGAKMMTSKINLKSVLLTCFLSILSVFGEFAFIPAYKAILFGIYHVIQLIFESRMFLKLFILISILSTAEALAIFFVFEKFGKKPSVKFFYTIGTIILTWFLSNFVFNLLSTEMLTNYRFPLMDDLKLSTHWASGIGGPSIGFPSYGSVKISLALIPIEISIFVRIILRIFKRN